MTRKDPLTSSFRIVLLAAVIGFLLSGALAEARPVLSPPLKAIQSGEIVPEAYAISELPGSGTVIDVFLEGDLNEAELAARGVVVGSRLPGGIWTAKVPLDRVGELATLSSLSRISAATRVRKNNDVSVPNTQATPNYWTSSPPSFTGNAGSGAIVGLVDTGIDWSHDDFKNPDGTTRILYIWDQNSAVGPNPPGFAYGRQWTAADIDGALCTEVDTDGHGTHVMGSAAGDGSGTGNGQPADRFIGMAPRADIIAVATDFSSTGVVDGVNYIFQRAAALGMPAVVNLSLGNQFGAHDGTETFDTAIGSLTGAGKIVVCSAGNEGNQSLHAEQLVPMGSAQTVTFNVPTYTPNGGTVNDFVLIDSYYDGSANMRVTLTSPGPSPVTVGPVNLGASASNASSLAGNIYVENGVTPSPSGDNNIYIQIYDSNSTRPPRAGTWTITLTPVSTTATTECDLWQSSFQLGSAGVAPLFTSDVDEAELIGSPGTADAVVTVAAFTTKQYWPSIDGNNYSFVGSTAPGPIADFSSPGPRRDNVLKPDIAAPGTAIVSTLSSSATGVPNALINPDGVHWTLQGTSMSAPHVTGGIALLLADDPTMTPAQVKTRLYTDAVSDGNTGAVPNNLWGYGKLRMTGTGDTEDPVVTVTYPNGGETLGIGTNANITWTATDNVAVTTVDIAYSINNGVTWIPLATGETNDGTYTWLVPNAPTVLAKVRVTAHDAASNTGQDVSDAVFTIADAEDPSVTVLQPNGGETLAIGAIYQIQWSATDNFGVTSVDLDYSTDNGSNWTSIATGETNDGAYDWTVPAAPTALALVRVTAHDAAGNTGNDVSDATFTIADGVPPSVTVTYPDGNESFLQGDMIAILWTASDDVGVTGIDLDYTIDDGSNWTSIATGEANDGTYDWTIPSVVTTLARVRVTAHDGVNSASDVSDTTFAISSATGAPFLPDVLTSPVILQNRPNPFSPSTRIGFGLPEAGHVTLRIYSASGRLVRELADREFGAGYTELAWDGRSDAGQPLPSGVYFYRFASGSTVVTRRMILGR